MAISADIMKMTPAEVVAGFNPREREYYEDLHKRQRAKTEADQWWYWDLGVICGKMLKEVREDVEEKIWNAKIVERMARALNYDTETVLRQAKRVASRWPTKTAFRVMLQIKSKTGDTLSWTHLVHLSAILDNAKCQALALTAAKQGWNTKKTLAEVGRLTKSPRAGMGGRQRKAPKSAADGMTHVQTLCSQLIKTFDTILFGKKFNIADALDEIPPDLVTEKIWEGVQATREKMQVLQDKLSQAQQLLLEVEPALETRLGGGKDDTISMAEHRRRTSAATKKKKSKRRTA